jgi:hypothetical protein
MKQIEPTTITWSTEKKMTTTYSRRQQQQQQNNDNIENEITTVVLPSKSSSILLKNQKEHTKLIDTLIDTLIDFQQRRYEQTTKNHQDGSNSKSDNANKKILSTTVNLIQVEISNFYKKRNINVNSQSSQEEIMHCMKHFFNCSVQSSGAIIDDNMTVPSSESTAAEKADANRDGMLPTGVTAGSTNTITTASKDSIEYVLQLTAAITASSTVFSLESCIKMVQYVEQIARTPTSETFRSVSCQWIGYLVHSIIIAQNQQRCTRSSIVSSNDGNENCDPIADDDNNSNYDITGSISYNDILDTASQALIPRFTDKSQIVRMAAIYAGANFFDSTSTATDPDILQAMIWTLQHDPSPINRLVSCTVIPTNLETIDYIITRIRDVKPKVRCAALRRLHTAFSPSTPATSNSSSSLLQLEPSQAAACLMAGWTNRYVRKYKMSN